MQNKLQKPPPLMPFQLYGVRTASGCIVGWTIIAAVVIEGLSEYAKTAFAATENERRINNGVCNTL